MATQRQIDEAYAAGRAAYRRDVGTHGPTLVPREAVRTPNPRTGKQTRLAWERGYNQDVRRVIGED